MSSEFPYRTHRSTMSHMVDNRKNLKKKNLLRSDNILLFPPIYNKEGTNGFNGYGTWNQIIFYNIIMDQNVW